MVTPHKPRFSHTPTLFSTAVVATALVFWAPSGSAGQSLRGSTASLDRQNRVAREHDYTFIDDGDRVRLFADQGWLVRIEPSGDFALKGVSYPYARREVQLFVERLASQYRSACGEQLVVTSLTRPTTAQPINASDRSVHPTGMALDLRTPRTRTCRVWLERVLLSLERAGVIEATLERFPVHYHIAVYPRQYSAYVEAIQTRATPIPAPISATAASTETATATAAVAERLAYTVRRGDSLWTIARSHGTTVDALRSRNQLAGSRIYVGQVLELPLGS
jgi:LysM repeat protein